MGEITRVTTMSCIIRRPRQYSKHRHALRGGLPGLEREY